MATFTYRYTQSMTPIGNRKYATTYIKQSHAEHSRMLAWLTGIGDEIVSTCAHDADLAEWFSRPHRNFRKSTRGQYYTPEELLTDMISQLAAGRDMTQAMLDRWNRLCDRTPWVVELTTGATVPEPVLPGAGSNWS